MSSDLSPFAIHRIIYFVEREADDRWNPFMGGTHPPDINKKWLYIYETYFTIASPRPVNYLRSLELALFLRKELDHDAMEVIFGHGKPLAFARDDVPQMLVPKIIQEFHASTEEPSFLDITLGELSEPHGPNIDLWEAWPQAYVDHLPCYACTQIDKLYTACKENAHSMKQRRFIVETFHIHSKHFKKRLTVELHFALWDWHSLWSVSARPSTEASPFEKYGLRQVTVRLYEPPCQLSPSGTARVSTTTLLQPGYALEVYRFLDREYIGGTLLSGRGFSDLILGLRDQLSVHKLTCTFEEDLVGDSYMKHHSGAYWMDIVRFHRELPYRESRRFKIPSEAGIAADCLLTCRYLSNSHVADFKAPRYDSRFAFKMIAVLTQHNVSLGTVRMCAKEDGLSDYRSLDTIFNGGMSLAALELRLFDHQFATFVKTTDFFRRPMVQRLETLKLTLGKTWDKSYAPRGWATVSSPLWIAGIHLLNGMDRFEVRNQSNRCMHNIELKLVQLCEKFERGEISDLVRHFKFAGGDATFPFSVDNKTASNVKVGCYTWDVYRFRNPTTGDWLTACIGRYYSSSVLHIVKGAIYPDASFAAD